MDIIYLIIGILVGTLFTYFISKYKFKSSVSKSEERSSLLEKEIEKTESELSGERDKVLKLNSELSAGKADFLNLQNRLEEERKEIEELQTKFTKEFENLANKILEEKSVKFTEQNRENLDQILRPLSEKIKDFEKKVEDKYLKESNERASLVQQIKTLHELNQQMSKDANNLTKALKGDSKARGSWGEFILESVLEKSGLVKDREYKIQESFKTADGKLQKPDVIVYLPDDKNIIVDSKVSLVAYEQFSSTDNEAESSVSLKEHIRSIRNHIKELGEKNYQSLYKLNSPDFVLMFVPIEPAFALAVQNDPNLFYEAFEKNIVIVSPTTLLATLRTIASIWKQEKQNKNALEIARQSGDLYDKFVGFVDDLSLVGSNIKTTQVNYDKAMNKLSEGRGNLIRKAENIKELGAKATKSLPQSLLDESPEENLKIE